MAESIFDITHRKNIRHEYFDRFDYENYGGTPVLGISKPVVIGHGISHSKAFANMIRLAEKMIRSGLMEKMQAAFEAK
jgi:glycerol-3-phosphate acyltransferase PlsX